MRYDLMAVIGVPLVMWVTCLGCGLALERILRLRLENALLLPLGLCVAFVLVFPGYVAGAGDVLAVSLLVLVGLAGLLLAQDGLRARLNPGWAGAAGLAAYVLYMLPVIAYGHWTWSGYDFVNDTSFETAARRPHQGVRHHPWQHPAVERAGIPPPIFEKRLPARHPVAPGHVQRPDRHACGGALPGLHRRAGGARSGRSVDAHAGLARRRDARHLSVWWRSPPT